MRAIGAGCVRVWAAMAMSAGMARTAQLVQGLVARFGAVARVVGLKGWVQSMGRGFGVMEGMMSEGEQSGAWSQGGLCRR